MGLREIRKERKRTAKKYTLEEMRDVLGVCMKTAIAYESDPSRMTYEQAVKVAKWLRCSPKDL